jgi:hypothetical protein
METVCAFHDALSSMACFEGWFFRYQTLLVGLLAFAVAAGQVLVALRQAAITKEQMKMAQQQNDQEKAIAQLEIDAVLPRIYQAYETILGACAHHKTGQSDQEGFARWDFDASILKQLKDNSTIPPLDVPRLTEAAVKAFPNDAPSLAQLFKAAEDTRVLAERFVTESWEQMRKSEHSLMLQFHEVDEALNRLFVFANKCGKLQPGAR